MNLKLADSVSNETNIQNDNVVSFKGLQKQSIPYIFIWILFYAWLITFVSWWTASPFSENLLDMKIRILFQTVCLFSSSLFIFIIKKEWFLHIARIGAVVAAAGLTIYFMVPNNQAIRIICIAIIGISLGGLFIGLLIPFVFALNNTEKLLAVIGSNALVNLFSLIRETGKHVKAYRELVFLGVIFICVVGLLFLIKRSDLNRFSNNTETPVFSRRLYITLFYNGLFAIIGIGLGKGVFNVTAQNYGESILIYYFLGGLFGSFVFVAAYAFSKKAIIWLGNISYSCVAMGLFINTYVNQYKVSAVVFAVLLGVGNTVGMAITFYVIGIVAKKYDSIRYLRLSIVTIIAIGGTSGVLLGNLIRIYNNPHIISVVSIISVVVLIIFVLTSTIFVEEKRYNDWAKDSGRIEIDNDNEYMFRKYHLSKRETEVCKLLLQGYTLRQTSAILSIAYSTVNTYCTCAYRKLCINSRTELLILFKSYVK